MPLSLDERPAVDWPRVRAVYSDGGVVGGNPSRVGGTWAFVYATEPAGGGRLFAASGHVAAAEVAPLPWVSNNLTEVVALVIALEQLPAGWAGPVYSDSLNAIRAVGSYRDRPEYLPPAVWDRVPAARERLGILEFVLLGGHPTRAELAAGVRRDGKPVSVHNVHCDQLCTEAKRAFVREGVVA
jgi:ribonuclease HI